MTRRGQTETASTHSETAKLRGSIVELLRRSGPRGGYMDRRHFVMGSLASASTALGPRALASPADTVRVACVGVRGRGRDHIRAYSKMTNVEIAAICDIDESILNARVAEVEKATGKRPAA